MAWGKHVMHPTDHALASRSCGRVCNGCNRARVLINAVVELDGTLPEVAEIARRHKKEMTEVLADLLKPNASPGKAKAVALVIDGAIVRAQMDGMSDHALKTLTEILHAL